MYKKPSEGGCWFCHQKDHRPQQYNQNYGLLYHQTCFTQALSNYRDRAAIKMARAIQEDLENIQGK